MHLYFILALIASSTYSALAATATPFNATFDDIKGSGLLPELTPTQIPYQNLAYTYFFTFNTSQAITRIFAESRPNVAASITALQYVLGQAAMISTTGTTTSSFDLKSLYNACVTATQTGLLPQNCSIEYTGVKQTTGRVVRKTCVFEFDKEEPELTACVFPVGFRGLKSVKIVPVNATLLPASTVVFIDTVLGTTYI